MATALKRSPDLVRPAAVGGAIAAIANTVAYFVALAVSGDLLIAMPGSAELTAIPAVMPAVASIIAAVGAYGLARIVSGRANPGRIFLIVATVVFVLFLTGPLGKQADTGTVVWLELMHVIAFAGIVPPLLRALSETRD